MEEDGNKKQLDYIDALEKTNKSLLIALQKMLGYTFTAERMKKDSAIRFKSRKTPIRVRPIEGTPEGPDVINRLLELITDMPDDARQDLLRELEEKAPKGSRRHYRKPFFTIVDYGTQDRVYKDFIQNISAGGLFIETTQPFEKGQEVMLTFPMPDGRGHIKITGEVVRTTPEGIGVRFSSDEEGQQEEIQSLLKAL